MELELTTKIEESPKRHAENSPRIIECLTAASAGFWEGCLLLDPKLRHRIKSAVITISVASDGTSPTAAKLDVTVHDFSGWTETAGRMFSRIGNDNMKTIRELFREQMMSLVVELIEKRKSFLCSEVTAYETLLASRSTQKPA